MSKLSHFLRRMRARRQPDNHATASARTASTATHSLAQLLPETEIVVTGNPPLRMATFLRDRYIGESIRLNGFAEERAILDVTNFTGIRQGRTTFLDVGANIGTHTLFALQHGFDRAICIEPEPDNYTLLRVNQILNGAEQRCININSAASMMTGDLQIELSEINYGDHRIRNETSTAADMAAAQNRKTVQVQADTINAMLEKASVNPAEIGMAWIDTQGHEGHVLAGASALEGANVPIVIEFWPYGLESSGGYAMLREFLQRQYRVLDIRKPLACQTSITLDELDRLFDELLKRETAEISVHTDLLILPKTE